MIPAIIVLISFLIFLYHIVKYYDKESPIGLSRIKKDSGEEINHTRSLFPLVSSNYHYLGKIKIKENKFIDN